MTTNNESIMDSVLKAGALLGGAWLAVELIKALSRQVYRCPNCYNLVQDRVTQCPHCGASLTWKI